MLETLEHLFYDCLFVKNVWDEVTKVSKQIIFNKSITILGLLNREKCGKQDDIKYEILHILLNEN